MLAVDPLYANASESHTWIVVVMLPTRCPPPFNLRPLMFETFVCSMAMMAFAALAGSIARMTGVASWQIGIVITVAGIGWMLMARPWGRMSDKLGRRPVILIGVAGFAACYVAMAALVHVAIAMPLSPAIVFIGLLATRGLAGGFYAAVPATSAALVADHLPVEDRPKAMATLGAAGAFGIVIGPATVGLLATAGLALPLILIGILPMIGWVVLWRMLPRDERQLPPAPSTLRLFDPRLRSAMTSAFLAMGSVTIAQVLVGFYAIDRLKLMPMEGARIAGIALGCVGVALIAAQLLIRRVGWTAKLLIRVGMFVGAAGFGGAGLATSAVQLCAAYAVIAFGMGFVFPSVLALATSAVAAHEQGVAAGTVSAVQGMAVVVAPLLGTALYTIDPRAPFASIAIGLACVSLGNLRRSPLMTSFGA